MCNLAKYTISNCFLSNCVIIATMRRKYQMEDSYPLALPEGTVLGGQYIIRKVLGQGGFGITYMAEDHKTGQKVAVKEFFPDTLATRTQNTVSSYPGERTDSFQYGKMCFLQEAETLAAFIGSENIVKIHSYFEENGTAYFVMDFVEGISFDEYIRQKGGKISYEDAERVLIHIMDALALVHSKGIVHRDVTPDNIYITSDGTVKLLDFGAARYSLGDKSRSLDVVLKHGFAPKEQYTRHGRQGPFTDVYTVGASFYFAITGKRPPDSIDRLEEDDLIPPSSLGVKIPQQKEDAILKAMSVQPQDRFQSMGEFKNALLAGNAAQAPQPEGVTNQRVFTAPVQPVQAPIQPADLQPTQSVQPQPVPLQQDPAVPKKHKTPVLVAVIGGAAVLLIAIVGSVMLFAGMGSRRSSTQAYAGGGTETPKPTQAPTAKPTETPKPTQASTEETTPPVRISLPPHNPTEKPQAAGADTVEILGNSVADIKNQNMLCTDPEAGELYYFSGNGLGSNSNGSLLTGVLPYSLSIVGDYLYYVDSADGKAYRVNKNGGESEELLGSSDSSDFYQAFYVSDSYWFAYKESGWLTRWNIQDGKNDGSVNTGSGEGLVTFSDGYLYYVDKTGEVDTVYKVPAGGDWSAPEKLFSYKEYVDVREIYVEDDRVYVLYDRPYQDSNDDGKVDANGRMYCINIRDAVSDESIHNWAFKSSTDEKRYYSNMRVEDGIAYYIRESEDVATGVKTVSIRQLTLDDGKEKSLYEDTDLDGYGSLCVLNSNTVAAYGAIGDTARLYWIPLDGSDPRILDYTLNVN